MKENNWENKSPGAIWLRHRSGNCCPRWKRSLCFVFRQNPPNGAQTEGINTSTQGSYQMNHSNKVVHLKWDVKRSLSLPRSSCFKTKTGRCVGAGWWLETGGHPWLRGRPLGGWTLRFPGPRTQSSGPVRPIRPRQPGTSHVHRLLSAGWGHSAPPPPPGRRTPWAWAPWHLLGNSMGSGSRKPV